jgi:hypothetical protein
MKYVIAAILASSLLLGGCQTVTTGSDSTVSAPAFDTTGFKTFGATVAAQQAVTLEEVVANLDQYEGKQVIVRAKVKEVCKTMGCWMMLEDGKKGVRVRFTESEECSDGFYVPRNCDGHVAILAGTIETKLVPEDWARHYAEDSGASPEEIAKIIGPQREVSFLATGVMLSESEKLEEPAA